VSLTLQKRFSGVIEPAETVSAVSMTPLKFGNESGYKIFHFAIIVISAVSLIPRKF
jgi:hypothetical protein